MAPRARMPRASRWRAAWRSKRGAHGIARGVGAAEKRHRGINEKRRRNVA
jgi:hypothetical protein